MPDARADAAVGGNARGVTTYASPKLAVYGSLAALGLLAALLINRPEPVSLATPFVLACVIGLTMRRVPRYAIDVAIERTRAIEGETVYLDIDLDAQTSLAWLQLVAPLPEGLEADSGSETVLGVALNAGGHQRIRLGVRCPRWGVFRLGTILLRIHDGLGFFITEARVESDFSLRVYPRVEKLMALVHPRETQIFAGNRRSRRAGEGIEFAGARPFTPGDQVRHVNWRLSSRLGEMYVNEQHLERNADIVLFLDSFSDVRADGSGTLELAVRATATLAEHYLDQRDRVGLLSFGGSLRWLLPGMGVRQAYRIVDALLDTETFLSYAWKGIDVIPPRTLPPNALVLALSPLLDARTIQAFFAMRGRGIDLTVVEVSPEPFVAAPGEQSSAIADRLWRLHREVLRVKLRKNGVPVARWTAGQPIAQPLAEVSTFRRSSRVVRA